MDGIRMNTECSLPDLFLPHRFIFPAPKENILNILFFRKYLQAVFFYSISLLSVILRSNFLFCDAFRGEKASTLSNSVTVDIKLKQTNYPCSVFAFIALL